MLVLCWSSVADGGLTLKHHWLNFFCLLNSCSFLVLTWYAQRWNHFPIISIKVSVEYIWFQLKSLFVKSSCFSIFVLRDVVLMTMHLDYSLQQMCINIWPKSTQRSRPAKDIGSWLVHGCANPSGFGPWMNRCWTATHYLTNVGPPSTTVAQHWSDIGSMCRVCWVGGICCIRDAAHSAIPRDPGTKC